jgi:hypothetical protein
MSSTLRKGVILLLPLACWAIPYAAAQGHGDPQYPDQVTHLPPQPSNRDASPLDDFWQKKLNPFKPGNAIKPADIKCSVVEWETGSPKPALTVVCPPPEVFSPLRVFLKFSWVDASDVPKEAAKVVAEPKTATRIQLGKGSVRAFLKISRDADSLSKEKWVAFNSLQSFAIVPALE